MAHAVIYARYSSSGQRDESIDDQVRVCTEEAARRGDSVVRVYADRAATGTEAEHRAQFQRMVADSASGAFELVYVYKTDRFARNHYDSAIYKGRLRKHGVRVVSATEPVGEGSASVVMEAMLEGWAEYYSLQLGENVRRGLRGNALRCRHNGVRVFGYDNGADGLFHVNEAEAAVVRDAFARYDAGMGMAEICRAHAGVRTKRGRALDTNMLGRILRDVRYTGLYRYDGVEVEGGMPRLVEPEEFERVQARLLARTRRRRCAVAYLLSGILEDEEGNRYQGASGWGKAGRKYTYYKCPKTRHAVPQTEMEGRVAALVRSVLSAPGTPARVAAMVMAAQEASMAADLAAIDAMRGRVEANRREQGRLVELAARTGAVEAVAQRLDALADEAASLVVELADLERGVPRMGRAEVEWWVARMAREDDPMRLIEPFVRRVVLDREADELRVEFSFDGQPDLPPDGTDGPGGSPSATDGPPLNARRAPGNRGPFRVKPPYPPCPLSGVSAACLSCRQRWAMRRGVPEVLADDFYNTIKCCRGKL